MSRIDELNDNKEVLEAKKEMLVAVANLRKAFRECNEAFSTIRLDCNEFIVGTDPDGEDKYPFELSFDEQQMIVDDWASGVINRLQINIDESEK